MGIDVDLTPEELREIIVQKGTERFCQMMAEDPDDLESRIITEVESRLQAMVDAAVSQIASAELQGAMTAKIETLDFQPTNQWGEPKSEPLLLRAYIEKRVGEYLSEDVDWEGRAKREKRDAYNWKGEGPRILVMIDKYIHSTLEREMKKWVDSFNTELSEGLSDSVKKHFDALAQKVRVSLTAGR